MLWERTKSIAIWYFLGCVVMLLWRYGLTHNLHAVLDAAVCGFIALWIINDKVSRKSRWDYFFVIGAILLIGFIAFAWRLI